MSRENQTKDYDRLSEVTVGRMNRDGYEEVTKFRVFFKGRFYDRSTPQGQRNYAELNGYLADLADGKTRKRMPPGVIRVEEVANGSSPVPPAG